MVEVSNESLLQISSHFCAALMLFSHCRRSKSGSLTSAFLHLVTPMGSAFFKKGATEESQEYQ